MGKPNIKQPFSTLFQRNFSLNTHSNFNGLLDERLQHLFERKRLLIIIVITSIIVGITIYRYRSFRGSGLPPTLDANVLCSPCASQEAKPEYCYLPEEFQFTKVIWFITDGWPLYRARKSLKQYWDHAVPFTHSVYGNKWSYAIYTSWFTGLPTTNLFADKIYGDMIFESIRRASGEHCRPSIETSKEGPEYDDLPIRLRYIGPEWCPIFMIGGGERSLKDLSFVQMDSIEEHFTDPHSYPSIPIPRLNEVLDEIKQKNESLIAHTGLFDKSVHMMRERIDTENEYLNKFFSDPTLKNFIDANPDYLLILSSDHGMSQRGSAFHGDAHTEPNENIGTFIFYNPRFEGQPLREIDVVDVLPTLAKYLKNVDIPFYSTGIAQNLYGNQNVTSQFYVNALKQNLRQLSKAMQATGRYFDKDQVTKAIESSDMSKMLSFANSFKEQMYRPQMPVYWMTLIILGAISLQFGMYWIYHVNQFALFHSVLIFYPIITTFAFVWWRFKLDIWDTKYYMLFLMGSTWFNDMMFSPATKRNVLIMNQFVHLIDYAWRLASDAIIKPIPWLLPSIGSLASMWESWHLYTTEDIVTHYSHVGLHLTTFFFFLTRGWESIYIAGVHPLAFLLYLGIPATFIYFGFKNRYDLFALPMTVMMLLLSRGNLSLVFFNFQFRQLLSRLFSEQNNSSIYSIQSSVMYVVFQTFWFFVLIWKESIDFQVDVEAGAVGVISWNEYPKFSGLLMGLSKVGMFLLAGIHIAIIIPNHFPTLVFLTQTFVSMMVCHWVIAVYTVENHALDSLLVLTVFHWLQLIIVNVIRETTPSAPSIFLLKNNLMLNSGQTLPSTNGVPKKNFPFTIPNLLHHHAS